MLCKTYAYRIKKIKAVLSGTMAHADKLTQWGVTPEYIAKINNLFDLACVTEQRRKAIKGTRHLTTVDQELIMAELEGNCGMIKKLVHFKLPREYWPEFDFRKDEYGEKETTKPTELESRAK